MSYILKPSENKSKDLDLIEKWSAHEETYPNDSKSPIEIAQVISEVFGYFFSVEAHFDKGEHLKGKGIQIIKEMAPMPSAKKVNLFKQQLIDIVRNDLRENKNVAIGVDPEQQDPITKAMKDAEMSPLMRSLLPKNSLAIVSIENNQFHLKINLLS